MPAMARIRLAMGVTMKKTLVTALAFLCSTTVAGLAAAEPGERDLDARARGEREDPIQLSGFVSAGYLTTSGANGSALSTGVRLAVGRRFALGFDLGYGLLAVQAGMQDRWWFVPSMAFVIPAQIGARPASFDLGWGLGVGTSSGYPSWSTYAAHPFTAAWEFQLEPTVRAHAIASFELTRALDVFVRADAAALVLPRGSNAGVTDSTWLLFSVGTRFRLL
jgi:hypothetical protein